MPSNFARSHTHTSAVSSTNRMRTRVLFVLQQRFLLRQLVLHFFHHFLVHTQETAALYLQLLLCLRHAFRLLA